MASIYFSVSTSSITSNVMMSSRVLSLPSKEAPSDDIDPTYGNLMWRPFILIYCFSRVSLPHELDILPTLSFFNINHLLHISHQSPPSHILGLHDYSLTLSIHDLKEEVYAEQFQHIRSSLAAIISLPTGIVSLVGQ